LDSCDTNSEGGGGGRGRSGKREGAGWEEGGGAAIFQGRRHHRPEKLDLKEEERDGIT